MNRLGAVVVLITWSIVFTLEIGWCGSIPATSLRIAAVKVVVGNALRTTGAEHAVLYVNLAGLTNVAVANDTGCLFTRAAAGGLDAIAQTLSERRGLTMCWVEPGVRQLTMAGELLSGIGERRTWADRKRVARVRATQLLAKVTPRATRP